MENNVLTLRGRVGSDIVLHPGNADKSAFARFRLVVPRVRRRDDGSWEESAGSWYTVKCWGNLALNTGLSLHKGNPVIVVGRPAAQAWLSQAGELVAEIAVNAMTLGHDLTRGITGYNRVRRDAAGMEVRPAPDNRQGDAAGATTAVTGSPGTAGGPGSASGGRQPDDPADPTAPIEAHVNLDFNDSLTNEPALDQSGASPQMADQSAASDASTALDDAPF